jgi:hypothetical protein
VKLCFCRGYQELRKDGPTRRIKIDIYLWHRLRKTLEDTKRRVEEGGTHLTEGVGGHSWAQSTDRGTHGLASLFLHWFSTALGFASTPLFQIGLIRRLRCILWGYISKASTPWHLIQFINLKLDQVIRANNSSLLRAPPLSIA